MEKIKQKLNSDHLLYIIAGISFLLILTRYIFEYANMNTMFTDPASQIVQMFEMHRTGMIFPPNWYDSTEIHLLTYLMYPISFAVKNGIVVRNIAEAICAVVLLILIIRLMKTLFRSRSWLIVVPIIFSNLFPGFFTRYFFAYGDYLQSLFCVLAAFILLFAMTDEYLNIRKGKYTVLFIVLYMISVCCSTAIGMQGWSGLIVPLCGGIVLLYYVLYVKGDDHFQKGIRNAAVLIVMTGAAGVVGTMLHKTVVEHLMHISGLGGAVLFAAEDVFLNVPSVIYDGIFEYILGIQPGFSFFSPTGIQTWVRVFAFCFLFVVIPYKVWKEKSDDLKVVLYKYFCMVSLLIILLIALFSQAFYYPTTIRYFIFPYFFIIMLDGDYIYRHYFENHRGKWIHGFVLLVSMLVVNANLILPLNYRKAYLEDMENKKGLVNYLKEQDLTFGFAQFTQANKNTALANGEVQVNSVMLGGNYVNKHYWLSSSDWYEPDYHTGETFLLVYSGDAERYEELLSAADDMPLKDKTSRILQYEDYDIWVFDYNVVSDFR